MTKTKVGRRGKHGYKSTRKRMSGGRWPWSSKPETSTPETPETSTEQSCPDKLDYVKNKQQGFAVGTYTGAIIRNDKGRCVADGKGTWISENGKIIAEDRDWKNGNIVIEKTVEKPKITGLENAMDNEGYNQEAKDRLRENEKYITGGKRKMRHRKSKNKTRTNKKRKHRRTSRR